MRIGPILILIAMSYRCLAGSVAEGAAVPFVGCPADGQVGPIDAPKGDPKIVTLRHLPLDQIAYYKGADGPGVYAPRGWHCRLQYGSSGDSILVTPSFTNTADFSGLQIHAQAIERTSFDGGTSGRFQVAIYASRLFPKLAAAFIATVRNENVMPASNFDRGPYIGDEVTYPATGVARFTTPADSQGLGTDGALAPANNPIRGIAVLESTGDWGIQIFRARLRPQDRAVEDAIMRLNEQCLRSSNPC
jgi:hypothetical protein